MGVNVRWQDEGGKRIEEILAPHMRISHLVLNTALDGTTCLQFIDPYGDTTFNRLQIPILIEELKSVANEVRDTDIRDHLLRVVELAEKSRDEVHTYLKFIGD